MFSSLFGNDSQKLSSGSNLVTFSKKDILPNSEAIREEKIKLLKEKYDTITILTSCGYFYIFPSQYKRFSTYIIKSINSKESDFAGFDHETFLFIFRYISYNIKIDLNTMCNRLGITKNDGLRLLRSWGYDESICTKESLL